jgi:tetratricopeptide (TPR) repeat protein
MRRVLRCAVTSSACLSFLILAALGTVGRADDSGAAYTHAESLIREHQWDQGLGILKQLLKSHPNDIRTLNLTGLAFTGKGDPEQADVYFKAALKMDPHFVSALKNLAINEFELKDLKEAQHHLQLALELKPDDPVINLYLGEIFFRRQEYQRAAEALSRAGDLAQRDANVAAHLAVSDLKTGRNDSALHSLDLIQTTDLTPQSQFLIGITLAQSDLMVRAIPYLEAVQRTYPASYDIGYDLALCYLAAKQYSQAITTVHGLIDSGHETAELDNVLAEAYVDNKETQSAVDALRRAIALDPEDDDNYLDFASLCMNNHAFDDASRVLAVGLRVHPNSARLIFERGILNAMQDHYDLAEKDFETASALDPEKNSGYIGLGVTYIETGKASQAIPLLRKRLLEQPDDANLLYLLGEALVRDGAGPGDKTFTEAQAALEKSIRLNPNLCLPHVALGSIYLQENRTEDAIKLFEEARLIDPREKSAYSHLAIAYRRAGQPDKAKEMVSFLRDINDQERTDPGQKVRAADEVASTPAPQKSN